MILSKKKNFNGSKDDLIITGIIQSFSHIKIYRDIEGFHKRNLQPKVQFLLHKGQFNQIRQNVTRRF